MTVPPQSSPSDPHLRGAIPSIEDALTELWPDLRVLDREVLLEPGVLAHLLARDHAERLVLVMLAPPEADAAALAVLDLLAAARRHASVLVRHVQASPRAAEGEPRIIVIGKPLAPRLVTRSRGLPVELLELRELRSASGVTPYLAPGSEQASETFGSRSSNAFLASLPESLAPVARRLILRLDRIDPELGPRPAAEALEWSREDWLLCRLVRVGERLRAEVEERTFLLSPEDPAALDWALSQAVAAVLQAYLHRAPVVEPLSAVEAELDVKTLLGAAASEGQASRGLAGETWVAGHQELSQEELDALRG